MTEIIVVHDAERAAAAAAEIIITLLRRDPEAVLGLATGSTPLALYAELAARITTERLDVSRVIGFALDEYVGLPQEHPQSYRNVITRSVVQPLGLTPALVHVPDGGLDSLDVAGHAYEQAILAAGGVDLQILGLGTDGHIGFNEPGSSLNSATRLKTLTPQTRKDNARFFQSESEVPIHCITQGLGTILRARRLLLLAFGESKARAVAAAVEGPVTASHPASAIQLHPDATVIVDEAAAARLQNLAYYQYAYNNKPQWPSSR